MNATVIDFGYLNRYLGGDRRMEREILVMFAEQTRTYLRDIETADTARARIDAAHAVKGSARGIGAHAVADLACEVERLSKDGSAEDCRRAIEALGGAIEAAERAIALYLDRTVPA